MTKYPIKLDIPVAWGELDALGHVNNIIYLRYFESVRICYFLAIGMDIPKAGHTTEGPILANARCDFRRPVTFPDTVKAEVGCSRVGTSSFTLIYRLHSQEQGECVAEGETVVVYYDYLTQKSKPLTPALLESIRRVEGD